MLLATSSFDSLEFITTLNNNDYSYWSKICKFDFIFNGEQVDENGFSDVEKISNIIKSGTWKNIADHLIINKVYYNVDFEHGKKIKNEWIELFNSSDEDINIKNWEICNRDKCSRINIDTSIEAGAYILISHDISTWKYWEVPSDVQTINFLGGQFEMNNMADMFILKDDESNIIDQVNWGEADENWNNYNVDVWEPGVATSSEGHMLGRIPSGNDTNTASDWKNLSLPEVEVLIPNGGEIWWIRHVEEIYWKASSTNESADSELLINLYYSKDSGDTWGFIGTTTNSGYYSFRVPLFLENFTYYVPSSRARIKIVAVGPENFMLQGSDESDEDFCPPIDYDLLTEEELLMLEKFGLYHQKNDDNNSASSKLLDLSVDLTNSSLSAETLGDEHKDEKIEDNEDIVDEEELVVNEIVEKIEDIKEEEIIEEDKNIKEIIEEAEEEVEVEAVAEEEMVEIIEEEVEIVEEKMEEVVVVEIVVEVVVNNNEKLEE